MAGNCPIFAEHMPCGSWCAWFDSTFRCQVLHELKIAIREGKIRIDVGKVMEEMRRSTTHE